MSTTDGPGWRGRAASRVWSVRREAVVVAGVALTAGVPLAIPRTRRLTRDLWRSARTRRLLLAGFGEMRIANAAGRMPRIRRVKPMPFGERVELSVRPGQWSDLFEVRGPALAAACRAASVRIEKESTAAHHITIDVVRRDPFAAAGDVPWADLDVPTLSMWDEVHLGLTEMGASLRLSLAERNLLIAGLQGTGKSTLLNGIGSHAAKSPDTHLLLIDPNEVQFGPWQDRALAYASKSSDDAIGVLQMTVAELDRRTGVLRSLPGVVRKVTREIAAEHNLAAWVLLIDELAYHSSVAGTAAQRAMFNLLLRDILSRCRALGIIPVAATQRPTSAVIPRDLADLFGLRCAFRTHNASNSDVILGEGYAKAGYNAGDIPLESRGVGWLLAEGTKPVKFKGAWVSDAQIADLSVTTIPLKPRSRPGLRVVADAA
jgi:S-DNA-T family DNA segregation ATPase FtsK/SpoIIIE